MHLLGALGGREELVGNAEELVVVIARDPEKERQAEQHDHLHVR